MINIGLSARTAGKVQRITSAELDTATAILRTLMLGK